MLWIFFIIIIVLISIFTFINKIHDFIIKNYYRNLLLYFDKYKYIF